VCARALSLSVAGAGLGGEGGKTLGRLLYLLRRWNKKGMPPSHYKLGGGDRIEAQRAVDAALERKGDYPKGARLRVSSVGC
jgi:hypothetical protein